MTKQETPDDAGIPGSLGMDLERSFQPAWTREIDNPDSRERLIQRHGHGEVDSRDSRAQQHRSRGGKTGPQSRSEGPRNRDRPPRREHGGGRERENRRGSPEGSRRDRPGERESRHRGSHREHEHRPPAPPMLSGWEIKFLPEPAGIEGLARQIKQTLKAYPLFDLARLVLEKPDRYRVHFVRQGGSALCQVVADGSLWTGEEGALQHACSLEIDRLFSTEETAVEPPKGNFNCVARCTLSGILIGPPNHHDYQSRVLRLHAEKFSRMPFGAYQRRIEMLRDEEIISRWKEEQSVRRVLVETNPEEGAEPLRFADRTQAAKHLRAQRRADLILDPGNDFVVSAVATTISESLVRNFIRQDWEKLVRFPLAMSLELGRGLAAQGCATFKLDSQVVYAGVVRPRPLDRNTSPVSSALAAILDAVAQNPDAPRPEQWHAMLAARPLEEETEEARSHRDRALLSDLHWLLAEGYLIDFAGRGFALGSAPLRKKKKDRRSNSGAHSTQVAAGKADIPTPEPDLETAEAPVTVSLAEPAEPAETTCPASDPSDISGEEEKTAPGSVAEVDNAKIEGKIGNPT